jgi:hypothetical protein
MTNVTEFRCSTFALDAHWASRAAPEGELGAHLARCEGCRAYLAHLDALEAVRPPLPVLGPGTREARRARESSRPRAARWAWGLVAAGGFALAAGVALFLARQSRETPSEVYVASKGTPAVELVVRRGDATTVWDGRASVRPGDVLALRVACEGLSRVTLAVPRAPSGGWTKLADAECPSDPSVPLPLTLVVDETPGSERLAVVVSRAPLDGARLQAAAEETTRKGDVWTVRFDLAKTAGNPR